MRNNLLNKLFLIIVCGCIGITSCATSATTEQATVTPPAATSTIFTPHPSPTLTPLPTPTATMLATATPPLPPTATATLQASPTAISMIFESRTCTTAPLHFDYPQELGRGRLANLQFEGDDLLTFEWWTDGPEPEVTPTIPDPTPDMMPGPYIASRTTLENGELDLSEGQFRLYPLDVDPPFDNPCEEECPIDVLSQSPDGKWQLVQVTDWIYAEQGMWLMSEQETMRLDPLAINPEWRWADDSSLLWLYSPSPIDSADEMLLVELNSPIMLKDTTNGLLSLFDYNLAFSPPDKIAQSIPAFAGTNRSEEALLELDLMSFPIEVNEKRSIPGIWWIIWNESTQSFLIQIIKEDSVVFQDLSGNSAITIPQSVLVPLLPILEDGIAMKFYDGSRQYALSESGRYLAWVRHRSGEIWVFDCGEGFNPVNGRGDG